MALRPMSVALPDDVSRQMNTISCFCLWQKNITFGTVVSFIRALPIEETTLSFHIPVFQGIRPWNDLRKKKPSKTGLRYIRTLQKVKRFLLIKTDTRSKTPGAGGRTYRAQSAHRQRLHHRSSGHSPTRGRERWSILTGGRGRPTRFQRRSSSRHLRSSILHKKERRFCIISGAYVLIFEFSTSGSIGR